MLISVQARASRDGGCSKWKTKRTVFDQDIGKVVGNSETEVRSGTQVENVALDVSGVGGGLGSGFILDMWWREVCAKETYQRSSEETEVDVRVIVGSNGLDDLLVGLSRQLPRFRFLLKISTYALGQSLLEGSGVLEGTDVGE